MELQVWGFLLRTLRQPDELTDNLQARVQPCQDVLVQMLSATEPLTVLSLIKVKLVHLCSTRYMVTPLRHKGHDPPIILVNKFMAEFNVIHWLRFLPDWIPGMGSKKIASDYRKMLDDVTEIPFDFTVRSMGNGTAKPSFVSGLLKDHPDVGKNLIRYGTNSLYDGGADTTVEVLNFFFLAMTLFPQVQAKAREEIDRVTGCARLPRFEDRESVPYVESVIKEAFRWQVTVSLGLPNQNCTKKREVC
ncbi:putative Cytochrome P450 [Seiridium unicorne]|uniref:Cytochrome P450 n=1 Tax=Seiridium unicorne TaxID=138068 RepID=A0ABR2VFX9_9PEZI